MFPKPKGFDRVGFIQCFLALFFVLWFLIRPGWGLYFAWPVKPALTALFLGAGFMLRTYFGYHLWRAKNWYSLRWSMRGDFVFLGVLFVTTWWHMTEMNWHLENVSDALRIFSLLIAHVWVLAYTFEPLTVFLLKPREPEADAPVPAEFSEGPLLPELKLILIAIFYAGTLVWALLFLTPEFANMRWPWELNPFDARIMSAWPAACAVWAISMYFMKDWAEVKIGVHAMLIFSLALFIIWLITFPTYDPLRKNGITIGLVSGLASLGLIYAIWKQEAARKQRLISPTQDTISLVATPNDPTFSTFNCTQCGGELHPDENQLFLTCPYCGSTVYLDKSRVVFHWYLAATLNDQQAASSLARWMAGNDTVKDLDKKSKILGQAFQYFPVWYFKAKDGTTEHIYLEPAAATSVTELRSLNLPAGDLRKYEESLVPQSVEPTVPMVAAQEWLSQKKVSAQQVTESALVHIPIFTFKYAFKNKVFTAAVEAATGRVLANIYPAKAEAPYVAVGCVTALVFLCLAGILAMTLAGSDSSSGWIGYLICIGGGLVSSAVLFAVASWVASRV